MATIGDSHLFQRPGPILWFKHQGQAYGFFSINLGNRKGHDFSATRRRVWHLQDEIDLCRILEVLAEIGPELLHLTVLVSRAQHRTVSSNQSVELLRILERGPEEGLCRLNG